VRASSVLRGSLGMRAANPHGDLLRDPLGVRAQDDHLLLHSLGLRKPHARSAMLRDSLGMRDLHEGSSSLHDSLGVPNTNLPSALHGLPSSSRNEVRASLPPSLRASSLHLRSVRSAMR
ncbi:MAG TPA: hypothetical protein PKD54_09215, partial [Pirellulaceae bacterium]|nr:hypothetical protein [Pirellulaceae bacterium]